MMSSGSSSTKKRKASNTHHDVENSGSSAQSCGTNLSQQMDAMMQIMLRMEEKCNRLEAKCNSLENIVKEQADLLDVKIDKKFKQHEYNDMLVRNQSWKYSVDVLSVDEWVNVADLTEDEAANISEDSKRLRKATEKLRRGEFPRVDDNYNEKGIVLGEIEPSVDNYLLPYWREFAEALKHFTPAFGVLPDDWESFFLMEDVQLNHGELLLLKDALINKPFQSLSFVNNHNRGADVGGMSVDAIMDIVDSNKHLRQLDIDGNPIDRVHIGKICSAVFHTHPFLVCLDLSRCFENGAGDEMMISLLTSGTLKLEKLVMASNYITSNVTTLLTDYLAADPQMKWLDLQGNNLTDNDAELLANALRSNTTLRYLDVGLFHKDRTITNLGARAFRLLVNDESNLNSVALSNHSCHIRGVGPPTLNEHFWWDEIRSWDTTRLRKETELNRARKIYNILSLRNKSLSNVQHFDGIDVKILPNMVEAVQRYSGLVNEQSEVEQDHNVKDLSIVYEVMRKWDKVFSLYGGRLD